MTIQFLAPVTVPVQTRTAKANPFTEFAATLAADQTKAVPFTMDLDKDEAKAAEQVAAVKRQLSQAGKAANVSIRSTVVVGGTKTSPIATFTAWAVARITKTRKDAAPAK